MAQTLPDWQEQLVFRRTDAWSRAARRALQLAAAHGRTLDRERVLLSDVRDLQALAWRLQRDMTPIAPSWPRRLD